MIFEDEVDELTNRTKRVAMIATGGGDELFLTRLMEVLEAGEHFELITASGDRETKWCTVDSESDE